MGKELSATYQVNSRWRIVRADAEFCRLFRGTEQGLIGRDIRDLLRDDWKLDFRRYVAHALVGLGEHAVTVPMVAPYGEQLWCKHNLEAILEEGLLAGFNATIEPRRLSSEVPKRWWQRQVLTPYRVWDSEIDLLARAD